MRKIAKLSIAFTFAALAALTFTGCGSDGSDPKDNTVAATVNGKPIMSAEVERLINQQAGGKQSQLSQLQLAQARLQVLDKLIQREVLFQRAEKEKLLPTEDQINGAINAQKSQSGMTDEDFAKTLSAQKMTIEALREDARKDLAINSLQDKYAGKISISDREVEEYYNSNRAQFKNERGVALAMVVVDPADNSSQGLTSDAKNETDAKLKIDGVYQQLKGGADFATVARAKSEDVNSLANGGDVGFATEDALKQNGFPQDLIGKLFSAEMQVGSFTDPQHFSNGKWYIFKLAEKRLQTENLTLESQGVRQQITQALIKARKDILDNALLEVAINEAKIVNSLASEMLSNPGNLGLRPAAPGAAGAPAASPAASTAATTQKESSPTAAASPAASPVKK